MGGYFSVIRRTGSRWLKVQCSERPQSGAPLAGGKSARSGIPQRQWPRALARYPIRGSGSKGFGPGSADLGFEVEADTHVPSPEEAPLDGSALQEDPKMKNMVRFRVACYMLLCTRSEPAYKSCTSLASNVTRDLHPVYVGSPCMVIVD